MGGAVLWIAGGRRLPAIRFGRPREGAWQRKMRQMADEDQKVDRILDKIRHHGMQSLTWWEKRFLHKATQRRREFDEQQSRRY
jgi:histidinol dehydrogenase